MLFELRTPTEEEIAMDEAELEKIIEQRQLETQINAHLWGYLKPYNPAYAQIDFWRLKGIYKFGRLGDDSIDICIPGMKISSLHCTLRWDGKAGLHSQVVVFDHSTNGTYINGSKIGKNRCAVLRDCDILSLASPELIHTPSGHVDDYRFQFHHMVVRTARAALDTLYTRQAFLGAGGYGVVWKSLDHRHNRMVAIKTVSAKPTGDIPTSKKLRAIGQEITIMERLAHPNVCELFQFYYVEPSREIHIVMEFVEGGDLCKYIMRNDFISEWLGRHLTFEICSGISYLHLNGISHRDIKPENILLTLDDPPRVKISDFGLSKNFSDKSFLQSHVGTLFYMAPEFFEADPTASYTYLVDSWAVGIVVYAMFTKQFPWSNSSRPQEQKPYPPSTMTHHTLNDPKFKRLPELCQDFIKRLMDPSTATRMSVNAAGSHAWLRDWKPVYDTTPYARSANMQRGESWAEALELIEREAEAAEREELGLSSVEEEDEGMDVGEGENEGDSEEVEEEVITEEVRVEIRRKRTVKERPEFQGRATRSMTRRTQERELEQESLTGPRRSIRVKKFTRQGTPFPPAYLP